MKRQNIKELCLKICESRHAQLKKELDECEQKLYDTMQYYGCGGPYNRQEQARDRRLEELEDLERFERMLDRAVSLKELSLYPIPCTRCGSVTLTAVAPFDDWHECATCRSMVHAHGIKPIKLKIADDGEPWQVMMNNLIDRQRQEEQEGEEE